jgi:hypothetical protein
LETSLRLAEVAREEAERLVQVLTENVQDYQPLQRRHVLSEPAVSLATTSKKRGRPPRQRQPTLEPEPVKWWLAPAKTSSNKR